MLPTRKLLRGSASNVIRLALSVLVGIVLPPILVHHLSQAEYSAWVLILQLSAYVNLLDLGLQTVVSKLIAENHSVGNSEANRDLLSTSFSVLAGIAGIGIVIVSVMVWRVPQLFHQMPVALLSQVRLGLFAIGVSAAFGLPFNSFAAVFTGLQEYGLPTVVALFSRFVSAAILIALSLLHASLFQLALAMAAVNMMTAFAQFSGFKRYAGERIAFSLFRLHRDTAATLLRSGGVLAIWTLGGLFVSGLDLVIVGHFDYSNTGYYAIAATATNLLPMVVNSLFSPLLPAVSSMQVTSTPVDIGKVTLRMSRYCTLVLCLLSLPLTVGAFPFLSLWVGHGYAMKTVFFLQILVISNFIRQLGLTYSLVVIATGRQRFATLAAVAEAVVNVVVSVWLARRIGALGVAFGTLAGAVVSLGLHLTVSMRLTRSAIAMPSSRFITHSLLRPLTCLIPLVLLRTSWRGTGMLPADPSMLALWFVATALAVGLVGMTATDWEMIRIRFAGLAVSAGGFRVRTRKESNRKL